MPMPDTHNNKNAAPVYAEGKKQKKSSWIGNAVYYLLLALALLAVLIYTKHSSGQSIFGYSAFTVITDSMYPEYPLDTLIIVREVDPGVIRVGDDISYIRSDNTLITHRVIEVHENYQQSGLRAFSTQGIANMFADKEKVYADNVVGLVIYHNFILGALLTYAKKNYLLVLSLVLMIIGFVITLRWLLSNSGKSRDSVADSKNNEGDI